MKFNIFPAIRKDKEDNKGFVPIYIFVLSGSKVIAKSSTGKKIHKDHWDSDLKKAKKEARNHTLLNSVIDKKINDITTDLMKIEIAKGFVAVGDIKAAVGKEKKAMDFEGFAKNQIKEKGYAPGTARMYYSILEKVRTFKPGIMLSEVDFTFLQKLEHYLRTELKNENNTIWGNLKFINTMINDAYKAGLIDKNPFAVYKRPKFKQTDRTFLSDEEVRKIETFAKETENDKLKKIATFFLFCCFTGLRFADAKKFRAKEHILDGERIVLRTNKTGKQTNIFINDKIAPLAAAVDADPLFISLEEYNRSLKTIAEITKINKRLSSHVGRHTFGAALVDLEVPFDVAKELLAHGSPASTKVYYHLKNDNLDKAMKAFNSKEKKTE